MYDVTYTTPTIKLMQLAAMPATLLECVLTAPTVPELIPAQLLGTRNQRGPREYAGIGHGSITATRTFLSADLFSVPGECSFRPSPFVTRVRPSFGGRGFAKPPSSWSVATRCCGVRWDDLTTLRGERACELF